MGETWKRSNKKYSFGQWGSTRHTHTYIHGDQKFSVDMTQCIRTILTQLVNPRWPSQNTFGMWTVLYWTRSSRTQFGVSINVWRPAGDTLNITCNFLYCNHQVHGDFLITLYKLYIHRAVTSRIQVLRVLGPSVSTTDSRLFLEISRKKNPYFSDKNSRILSDPRKLGRCVLSKCRELINLLFCGAATQRGSWPPHSWGF